MKTAFASVRVGRFFRNGRGIFILLLSYLEMALSARAGDPSVYTQPQSKNVARGMNVTFTVYPSGTPPIRFQWRFNDTNLSGATNSSLVLSNVQWTNAGAYSVVLSNSVGQATSSNALLVLGSIATWGATPNPPLNLTNATALSGWNQHYLALQPDGTVRAWGRNDNGQTDVPAGLSNVIAVCTSVV